MHKLVSLQLKKGCDFSSKGLRELFVALHPSTTGSPSGLRHLSVAECTGLDDTALQAIADRLDKPLCTSSNLLEPTVIKGKLLLPSYEQLCVVQYGEIGS